MVFNTFKTIIFAINYSIKYYTNKALMRKEMPDLTKKCSNKLLNHNNMAIKNHAMQIL